MSSAVSEDSGCLPRPEYDLGAPCSDDLTHMLRHTDWFRPHAASYASSDETATGRGARVLSFTVLNVCWGSCTITQKQRLQRCLNLGARTVACLGYRDHLSDTLSELG